MLVVIDGILEKQPKKLKDVKGLVISDYQNYLEKKWLDRLRSKNTIRINQKTLDSIKKAYSKRLNSAG
jgi:peptidyl-prolyl cis-trans isomerase SurA